MLELANAVGAPARPPAVAPEDANVARQQAVREDYLAGVLSPQRHYSFPREVEENGEDGTLVRSEEPVHFQVISLQRASSRLTIIRSIQIQTQAQADAQMTAALAVHVQYFDRVSGPSGAGEEEVKAQWRSGSK